MDATFEEMKNEMKKTALNTALNVFPKKVFELDSLLKNDPKFNIAFDVTESLDIIAAEDKPNVEHPNGESWSLKRKLSDVNRDDRVDDERTCWVEAHSNQHLVQMANTLKKELVAFTDSTLGLSMGINLMVPQMGDGNNFGVEIQQEVIDATINAENDVYQRLQQIHIYFSARAELVIKLIKHPNCEDFQCAIFERDRQFHRFARTSIISLRNQYMALHDMVTKNLSKIKEPKSSATNDFLY